MSLQPYSVIFPEKEEPVMALQLDRKTGKIPKGAYGFIELYCTDKECDCRRTTLFVLNEKMQEKAVISLGFDPDDDMAGPFLDGFYTQSPYAGHLLDIFVELINDNPEFLDAMHRHYREVRTKVEGKKYRGKPFPKAGIYERYVTEPPELPGEFMDIMKVMGASGTKEVSRQKNTRAKQATTNGIRAFADRYFASRNQSRFDVHHAIQDDLRRYILDHETFALEISALLAELFSNESTDDNRIDAALRMLLDVLEILRVELERERSDSTEHMERLQNTLAQKIYVECGDTNLCAAVSYILLQSRVELLPVLHSANNQRLLLDAHSAGLRDSPPEEILDGMFKSIEDMGTDSPFEALENLLQILALGDPEMQTALCDNMLHADSKLVRDAAALMLLHPMPDVRLGVSRLLAADSSRITPETLRRLIITRNWFQDDIRKNIDQAVTHARRSRVECAQLSKSPATTVYASPVDGAFAQSFQVISPDGKGYFSCAILLKQGTGIADAFVIPLSTKNELNRFLDMMKQEGAFIESSPEYLDQRVCHGLAEGAMLGNAPIFWLAHVAELLGKDQWKAVPFDAKRELAVMRAELERKAPELLADKSRKKALKDSAEWCDEHHFANSWFEDNAEVDKVISAVFKKKRNKPDAEWSAMCAIIENVLEKRRAIWLERLVLNALWLKSAKRPPLPWHQMFHLAEAVADSAIPLAGIPLMESVAIQSLEAYLSRREDEGYW
ncbi:MAG: hypothetical protein PHF56_19490 [Desulfuromonadaceae bacterium]|nr:hypothetical protein [Desulfuromonadaceae bacterium]